MSYDGTDTSKTGMTDKELLDTAKPRYKRACSAETKQREREKEDLEFQVPELQWTKAARAEREGGNGIPARPILSISKLDQPIQLVLNQARQSHLGVNIHPVSEKANKETAEVLQGLYRRIERDSNANQARLWALQRALWAGRGWYRVNSKWDEDSDPKYFDQEIIIERILHQDSVYADPSAQKMDFSDGEWAFVTSWVPYDTFKRLYPDSKIAKEAKGGLSGVWSDFKDWITDEPEWVKEDGDEKSVLVCEYFYKVHTTETIESGERKRERDVVTVKWAKLTGYEVLDKQDWDGKYIPLIPVIGRELQPVNGQRWWVGLVRHARDAQRFFNTAASALLERMGMEPKSPWVMPEGQDEGHETEWNESNVRNRAVLHYKPTSLGEKLVPPPARAQLDMTGMSIALQGVQVADQWIQANTSVYDQSLGKSATKEESGRKVLALQGQSDASTSDFLANLSDAILYESLVVTDMMPAKYDRPGRITQILGDEDDSSMVMINAPYVMDADGRPVEAPDGQPGFKLHDFATRGYTTSISVGKSFQTRLQQGMEQLSELIPNLPPELQVLALPTVMRFMDTPGAKELADLLAKYRDSKFQGLVGKDGEKPTPEQLQAQLQGMKQQNSEMMQQLQMAVKQIETDAAKQQAAMFKAQLDAKTALQQISADLEKARMDNAAKINVAQLNAESKGFAQETEARNEALALGQKYQHESAESESAREHEARQSQFQAAHEVGMGAAGGQSMTMTRDEGQEQGTEEGGETSEATLPPEPAETGGEA